MSSSIHSGFWCAHVCKPLCVGWEWSFQAAIGIEWEEYWVIHTMIVDEFIKPYIWSALHTHAHTQTFTYANKESKKISILIDDVMCGAHMYKTPFNDSLLFASHFVCLLLIERTYGADIWTSYQQFSKEKQNLQKKVTYVFESMIKRENAQNCIEQKKERKEKKRNEKNRTEMDRKRERKSEQYLLPLFKKIIHRERIARFKFKLQRRKWNVCALFGTVVVFIQLSIDDLYTCTWS